MNHVLRHFLNFPVLDVYSAAFPFPTFTFSQDFSELPPIDFPATRMLGKQAEFLFETLISYTSEYDVLLANLQVQGREATLGELDYILKDKETGSLLHVELACKFYLWDPTIGNQTLEQWIGPNRKDRLSDKLEKLKNKQFPMLQKTETRDAISTYGIHTEEIAQKLCMKAQLYIPASISKLSFPEAYQACIVGVYMRMEEFLKQTKTNLFTLPEKKEWLVPPENLDTWLSFDKTLEKVNASLEEKRSILVYEQSNRGLLKYFVVWW